VTERKEKKTWYRPLIVWAAATLVMSIAAGIGGWQFKPTPPPVVVEVEKEVVCPAPLDEFAQTTGWIRDPETIVANLDQAKTLHFAQTPAGKAVMGDGDAFLWRAVQKHTRLPAGKYPNVNQKNVGCCVGTGWKHCADVVQATAIAGGAQFEWKPICAEAIYGGSRVEVGGGRISGDGSLGAWAAKWSRERGGLLPMEKIGAHDLTVFDPLRARDWGRRGVPDELEPFAKTHPVKGCALVTSWTDVKRSVQQGYPVAVCSDQGFRMERDATGRARPQGVWPHCLALVAVRSGPNEGAFLLNSWGDQAHTGPVWPPDMPVAGFWADASVIDRMVRQGDSFALADVAGFPARKPKPDWFVRAPTVWPERSRPDPFVLKSEVSLSW
jgi:hypothetical protein